MGSKRLVQLYSQSPKVAYQHRAESFTLLSQTIFIGALVNCSYTLFNVNKPRESVERSSALVHMKAGARTAYLAEPVSLNQNAGFDTSAAGFSKGLCYRPDSVSMVPHGAMEHVLDVISRRQAGGDRV